MKLNKTGLGLSMGVLWGGCLLVSTIWVLIRGGGEHLMLVSQFYLGYSVSWGGAVVGLVWGFVDGFICGWLLAWLYNLFAGAR